MACNRDIFISLTLWAKCRIYFNGKESGKVSKDKIVPLLNLIKHYAMKAYGGVDV
jgi:hypothetical protein